MGEVLDSGHVVTDEDVDTARLIMELDEALGRPTDALTKRVAATPANRINPVLDQPPAPTAPAAVNGYPVTRGDALVRALTSEENAAELARAVAEQLPPDMDPAEQARVVSRMTDVIRRRLSDLVRWADPSH